MANPPKLLSGRVPVVPLDQLSNTRYQFLGLGEAEPNLGNGIANSILTIQSDGTRVWANTVTLQAGNFVGNVVGGTFYGNFVGNINGNGNVIVSPGSNTQVLFNDSGNIGANANLTFDKSTALLTVRNISVVGNVTASGILSVAGNITSAANIAGNFVAPGANREMLFNSNGLISSNAGIIFDRAGPTLSLTNTAGTIITAYLSSLGGSDLQITPATSTLVIWASANPRFSNTYTLGTSTFQWRNIWAGNANIGALSVAGISNLTGNLNVAANAAAGNISTTGLISAVGNITGNNITSTQNVTVLGNKISSGTNTGILFAPGNTSLFSSNIIIDGGYIYSINGNAEIQLSYNGEIGSIGVFNNLYLGANGTGNLTVPGTSNLWGQVYSNSTITAAGNITANSVTANLTVSATGNITGGNIITSGLISATGNVQSSANLVAPRVVTSNIATNNNSLTISTDADFNINIHPSGNGTVDLNDHRITNLGTPSLPDDAVTKEYVDTQTSSGLHIHQPAKWLQDTNLTATYANGGTSVTVDSISGNKTLTFTTSPGLAVNDLIVFTNSFNGITGGTPYFVYSTNGTNQITLKASIAGVEITTLTNGGPGLAQAGLVNSGVGATLTNAGANVAFIPAGSNVAASVNDRILIINQSNGVFNGVYTVSTVGNASAQWIFTRSTDEDTYSPSATNAASVGDYVLITDGDHIGDAYVLTDPTGPIVFGTSNIQWTQFSAVPSYNGANGVSVVGLTISANVDNITTAIVNGNIVVKDSATLTTPNIGAATGTSLSVTGNLTANNLSFTTSLSGNIATLTGNVTVGNLESNGIVSAAGNITGNNLSILTEANLNGNLHALGNSHFGQSLNFAAAGANIQYAGTANSYLQLIAQNKDNGSAASTDFVATADNGTDNDTYIDLGINSSAYNQATYEITRPNDGYLYIHGNTTTGGGNLVLGTITDKDIIFATGGLANANLAGKFQHGNGLTVVGNVYAPNFIGNVGGNGSNIIVQGPNTGVVFNDNGQANSTLGFTFNKTSNTVSVVGNVYAGNVQTDSLTVVTTGGANITGGNLTVTEVTGMGGAISAQGNITAANINTVNLSLSGNVISDLSVSGNVGVTSNVSISGLLDVANTATLDGLVVDTVTGITANAGNVDINQITGLGGYLNAVGANLSGNLVAAGNISGNYYTGNGYFLTGISVDTSRIYNGTSNVRIDAANGNVAANVAGSANVLVLANTGAYVDGVISASGNITGNYYFGNGYFLTGISVDTNRIYNGNSNVRIDSANGNIQANVDGVANVVTFANTGLYVSGLTSVSGNVTANNFIGNANASSLSTGTVPSARLTGTYTIDIFGLASTANTVTNNVQPNITSVGNLTSLSVIGNIDSGPINTNLVFVNGNITSYNANLGNLASANFFNGNGIFLTNIAGGNVSGQVSNALVAGTVYLNAQPNITSVGILSNLSVSGNVTADYYFGNGSQLSGIITSVANINNGTSNLRIESANANILANVNGTANVIEIANTGLYVSGVISVSSNITTGTFISATGNVSAGNLVTTGVANVTGNINSGNVNTAIVSATGNITGANVNTTGIMTATGNIISSANVSGGNLTSTGMVTATGNIVSSANVTGANITTAGLITATGNITGGNVIAIDALIGNSANVNGNVLVAGNLTVTGNTNYINVTNLNIQDPIIGIGRGANDAPLSSNDGKDRGEQLWYYTTGENSSFIGYKNASGKLIAATNVSIANEVVTVNNYGNIIVGNLEASTVSSSGNVTAGGISTAGNITGNYYFGNGASLTGLPTLTSVYYLISLQGNVTGNSLGNATLTASNSSGVLFPRAGNGVQMIGNSTAGIITLSTIGSVNDGTLFGGGGDMELVTDSVTVSIDLGTVTDLTISSAYDLDILVYGAPTTVESFTVTDLLTTYRMSATGNVTVGNLFIDGIISATGITTAASSFTSNGNITGGNVISNGVVTATGNVIGGNITTSGIVSATGNITASGNISGNFILGNGSQLTGIITTVSNISNGNSNITAVSANGNITVSVAGNSNVVVFSSGQVDIKANMVPATANVFSLGNASHRWTNLWVSGNTITLGNIVLNDENANDLGIYTSNGTTSANVKAQIINTAAFAYNSPNITASGNISNVYNAMGAGPITIGTGVTVTVNSGAVWTIV